MSSAQAKTGLNVLVIEDQRDIAANIWDFLERRGHQVDHAADGEQGLRRALEGGIDVIVLDLGLPRLDGLELCRRLRAAGHGVPVLMLTARDTLDDKLIGFAQGADDYLVKPFSMKELEVRVRAVHRRGQSLPSVALRAGELGFNPDALVATRGDKTFVLTQAQARILTALLRAVPGVVSHEQLIRAVWGDEGGDRAALHTHIYALRALIDRGFDWPMIVSAKGIGYRLAVAP